MQDSSQRQHRRPWHATLRAVCLAVACCALSSAALADTPKASPATTPSPALTRAAARELVIAVRDIPADLNPLFATSPEAQFINGFLRRPLTAFDKDWQLACILCVTVPTVENGLAQVMADGSMTVTYTLPENARWGDDTPLTTRDVLFSWQALQTQPEALAARPWTREIASLTRVDDRTFTVRWQRARYDYNRLNDLPLLPEHVERLAFRNTATYRQASRFVLNPSDPGLNNGPYRIAASTADTLTLEPSPTWWGTPKPWFRRIILRRLPDLAAVKAAAGEVDLLPPGLSLPFEEVAALQDSTDLPHSRVVYLPGTSFEHIDFNLDNPLLQDTRVRQALLHGLNREVINQFGLENRYQVATSLLPAADPAWGGGLLPNHGFDLQKAAKLLEAAGWTQRDDGFRYNAAGDRLRLAFTTSVRNPARGLIQQVARNFWQRLGVEIVIDNVDQATLVNKVLPERAFNGLVLYSWSQQPQELPWFLLHSSAIPAAGSAVVGRNYAGWRDAEMDALLTTLATETRAGAQRQLWLRLQQRYLEELPSLPLYFRPVGGVLPKTLRGFPLYGHRAPASLWAEGWQLGAEATPPAGAFQSLTK